jgi:hypothetical protein
VVPAFNVLVIAEQAMAERAAPAVELRLPPRVSMSPTSRRVGHDAVPNPGALWLPVARRSGAAGRGARCASDSSLARLTSNKKETPPRACDLCGISAGGAKVMMMQDAYLQTSMT